MPFAAARLRFRFDLKCVIDDRPPYLSCQAVFGEVEGHSAVWSVLFCSSWKKRAVRSATSDENGIHDPCFQYRWPSCRLYLPLWPLKLFIFLSIALRVLMINMRINKHLHNSTNARVMTSQNRKRGAITSKYAMAMLMLTSASADCCWKNTHTCHGICWTQQHKHRRSSKL